MKKRFTHRNPDGSYRVWMDQAGEFRMQPQGGELFCFGDLINRLGELEDQEEKKAKK